ncbi:hypothetical protein [Floridanema evergladense]|uniref:Uncharacterized protein n=1 Tax=Floridaenema evergladense BLCC-F167 TaxID=3153639 RepID=A0ABV4WD80_9CYAN
MSDRGIYGNEYFAENWVEPEYISLDKEQYLAAETRAKHLAELEKTTKKGLKALAKGDASEAKMDVYTSAYNLERAKHQTMLVEGREKAGKRINELAGRHAKSRHGLRQSNSQAKQVVGQYTGSFLSEFRFFNN